MSVFTPSQWAAAAAALDGPLTFRGIPLVYDETMAPDKAKRCYLFNAKAGEALLEAGYEAALVRLQTPLTAEPK